MCSIEILVTILVSEGQVHAADTDQTVALSVSVTERSAVNLELRGRYPSNAGLTWPNGGINSCLGVVGYSVFF